MMSFLQVLSPKDPQTVLSNGNQVMLNDFLMMVLKNPDLYSTVLKIAYMFITYKRFKLQVMHQINSKTLFSASTVDFYSLAL